ncbi:TrbI/VirB10 family protein [Campylobacter lari]|uniref:DNA type IV secretion system protein ComB10 n=1 Tax=Campylobacter volucris TaxID=1031542 RepID=UPI00189F7DFE|nr:DNA type IV secretion system protein ComB10 [Campylobacter volucris]EFO9318196.1 TrbI/VirB10 family protein [Campylobacter lari]MBF7049638.1 DNA type IV secretion system protein ComB10 [Campylobacter volucris]
MKKIFLNLSLICCFYIHTNAENIFEENITNKNNQKNNIQMENLDYLFENSDTKFPITDYIYKGGFKEPNENNIILKDEQNEKNDNNQTKNILVQIEKQKAKLEKENERLNKEIQIENSKREEDKVKKLIRDSILAERANTKIYFQDTSSRFGADGFSNQKSIDISTNEHRLYRMIRAGRLIPAILTSAISSDLSGIVTAQIEQDIYATMGRAVLIPRGSKAIGFYKNDNKIGQNRLEINWREIITPQGVNILLTGAIASDNMGMSGALGSVNNKYLERYGVPYALSTASNVLLLSIASKIKGNNTYAQEIYSQSKNDVSTIVDDIIQQQSQIKPTIEIKSGSRIFIVPTTHMWFAKPKNNEVLIKYFQEN